MLKTFGVFYIYPLPRFSITIWSHEKIILKREAEKKKIEIKFLPKRIIYDKKSDQNIILDYSIDADVCPFLDETREEGCTIYNFRPFVCRAFPMIRKVQGEILFGKCNYIDKKRKYPDLLKNLKVQERMLKFQQHIIDKQMDVEKSKVIKKEKMIDFLEYVNKNINKNINKHINKKFSM